MLEISLKVFFKCVNKMAILSEQITFDGPSPLCKYLASDFQSVLGKIKMGERLRNLLKVGYPKMDIKKSGE